MLTSAGATDLRPSPRLGSWLPPPSGLPLPTTEKRRGQDLPTDEVASRSGVSMDPRKSHIHSVLAEQVRALINDVEAKFKAFMAALDRH